MKKLVLGALCIVLGFAANAKTVQINGLHYDLDDETKTAATARGSGTNNTVVNNTVRSLPMGGDLSV